MQHSTPNADLAGAAAGLQTKNLRPELLRSQKIQMGWTHGVQDNQIVLRSQVAKTAEAGKEGGGRHGKFLIENLPLKILMTNKKALWSLDFCQTESTCIGPAREVF